jgi:serine/threonine protein kinase
MQPTILIVEGHDESRNALEKLLRKEGFQTQTSANAAEAIDHVLREKPHFILLDSSAPGKPAEDFCRGIKQDPFFRDIVILVLGSASDMDRKLACFSAGANDFLTKPLDSRELIARLKSFLRMIEDWKGNSPSAATGSQEPVAVTVPPVPEKEKSYPTVDFVGTPSASDSSIRIRPKYGVYRVETLIGSGAMGHVFKAYDEPLERFVAIKILSKRLSSSPAFVERFRREAKVLAAINHPGIAFIYSFGEEEGEHYFAIQWCSGGSVSDLIRKKQRIEFLPALDIILQSARALEAASKKGVVHRDIKPSNILFDENQQVKIVDFGLASAEKMSARITQVQEFLGTPSFMAPEQAQSASVDHRADIYSLGITFYYMLYGKLPFTAATAIEMVIKHASQPFPSYEDDKKIPRGVFQIIEKMTQKNPDDRYVDYASLIQDLELLRNEQLSQSHWKIPKAVQVAPEPAFRGKTFFDLLSKLASDGSSGVLKVRWVTLQKVFLIRQREIILFESSQTDENIWPSMLQKNLLQKEQLPAKAEDLETSLNRFLLNRTFTLQDFKTAYRDLMKAALMQVFFWPVFEGEFALATIEHDAFASIRLTEIMLEAARSLIEYKTIRTQLPVEGFLQRTSTFEDVLSTLSLKPEESFIASRLEGMNTTLDTLQLLTGLPEERIARFVFALRKMDAIEFKAAEEKRARKESSAMPPPSPAAVPGAKQKSPAGSQSQTVKKPVAAGQQSEYLRQVMNKRFADSSLDDPKKEAIEKMTQQVRMEVVKSERTMEMEHHVRVAEQFYKLAEEKFDQGDFWNVAQLCKQAVKNHPTESKYYHLMALAYAQHPRFGKDAEQCFYKAQEMDPWNPDYHVDLAKFYFNNGLSKRALTECQKALKLSPLHFEAKKLHRDISED